MMRGMVAIWLAMALGVRVWGMAGDLDRPSLAFPKEIPAPLQSRILSALAQSEARFLHGRFINADTTLVYGGSTSALSTLLTDLAGSDGLRTRVKFVRGPANESWTVRHNAWGDARLIEIQVNVAAANLDWQQLVLPTWGANP